MEKVIFTSGYLQVETNGFFSFGERPTMSESPSLFNGTNNSGYRVAPYWSDIDTSTGGRVSYEIHTNKTSLILMNKVSKYIREREQNTFSGTWMLLAEWNNVPSPGK